MADHRYRAAPSSALRVERLDELAVIFDRRSMQTHLISAPMPEILEAMGESPCDTAMIVARLARRFELGDQENIMTRIAERLAELAELGLVEIA